MFQPANTISDALEFDYENFDWDILNNNRFDEITARYFEKGEMTFVVSKVSTSKLGDLKVLFENGFYLEVITDISGDEECWRFFEQKSEMPHLVVNGSGIEFQ